MTRIVASCFLLLMLKTVIDGIRCKSFYTDYICKVFIIVQFLRKAGLPMLYVAEIPNMPLSFSLLLLFSPHNIIKNFRCYLCVFSPVLILCVIGYIFLRCTLTLRIVLSEYLESSA